MWKALALSLVNVLVIAVAIAFATGEPNAIVLVGVYGTLPALICGMFVGAFASAYGQLMPAVRFAVIVAPCVALVFALAAAFEMLGYAPIANGSTIVLCLVLERWTRAEKPLEQVPTARVA